MMLIHIILNYKNSSNNYKLFQSMKVINNNGLDKSLSGLGAFKSKSWLSFYGSHLSVDNLFFS